jgi:hypothetical protein
MSENKLVEYKVLLTSNPMKIPIVIRLLEFRDEKEPDYNEGYTFSEIEQTLEKLGDESSREDNKKSLELAYNWGKIRVVPKPESEEDLYQNRYDFGEGPIYDSLLELTNTIEIEPRKVKVNVDL